IDFCPLTLDPNTNHNMLYLSEGDKMVTWRDEGQLYPDHPDRFTEYYQVLCKEALSGTCYWEVRWTGERAEVAMAYKEISRQRSGNESDFGRNDKSWTLNCCPSGNSLWHNNRKIPLPPSCSARRVGVYLDHGLGILAFYDVSSRITLLHRVQTEFSQPLYPGFYVPPGSCVKILTPFL
ncbi:stonustoxin subunit beta-like, partial [Aplochiton taeniatus]